VGFYPTFVKIITIFTARVKDNSDFGFWISDFRFEIVGWSFGDSYFAVLTLCSLPYALCLVKFLLVFVFMPMMGVRPVLVCVCGRLVFMPMAVGDGLPHFWKRVIVVPVVVTMPVFMRNPLVMV
jgi:hypothetical protein